MNKNTILIIIVSVVLAFSCTKEWDAHFYNEEESVNVDLWDTLQTMDQYSEFVKYVKQYKLDTIIESLNTLTLFIPGNNAFKDYLQTDTAGFSETLNYHITPTYFMIRNVKDYYKLKTLEGKYAIISNQNNTYAFDGINISYTSPSYLNGKFYELDSVALPKPNLYQYISRNSNAIIKYIDTQDSIILDKEKSKPIGFNDQGQTIYDSVVTVINLYEEEYFAITQEYENITATIVVPDNESYINALNNMALLLGGSYTSYTDIPLDWQYKDLIPVLLNKGTYGGIFSPEDFNYRRIANVLGDSILIDFEIDPNSKYICSNGVVYNYKSFIVGDSLFREKKLEGEEVALSIGLNNFIWDDEFVTVTGNKSYQPKKLWVPAASNDTTVEVIFSQDYHGKYTPSFKLKRVFPGRYRLIWRTNYRTSGIYSVYLNDEKLILGLEAFEEFDTRQLTTGFFSILGYKLYPDSKGFCTVDARIDIEEYGDVIIKFEYKGPGESSENGFSIDYLQLLRE